MMHDLFTTESDLRAINWTKENQGKYVYPESKKEMLERLKQERKVLKDECQKIHDLICECYSSELQRTWSNKQNKIVTITAKIDNLRRGLPSHGYGDEEERTIPKTI